MTNTLSAVLRASQALRLAESQERLERQGWGFTVIYLEGVNEWSVWAMRSGFGPTDHFERADRSDCLAQALQFATMQEELINRNDAYDQDTARDDTIDRYEAMREARRDG